MPLQMSDSRWPKSAAALAISCALGLLTTLLLLLVFPRFDLHFLASIALTPLLVAVARLPGARQRFLTGWVSGTVFWFFLCTWIQFVLEDHASMGKFGSWGAFVLFAVLKGLHMAVFAWLAGPLMNRVYALPAVAALWTGLERTHATFGFTWMQLGNAGIDMAVPLRLAPLVGVYGVSFVFAMLSAGVACVLLRQPRLKLAPLLVLPFLYMLPALPKQLPSDQSALVVQPNVDTEQTWTYSAQERTEHQLLALSNAVSAPLVIWPELPAPLYYYSDPDFRQTVQEIAARHKYFLFETVAYKAPTEPLNSALLLSREGTELGRYDKIDLVPFGEYVPSAFSWVNRVTQEAGDFVPGTQVKVLNAGPDRMGVFICYEAAFPELVRQFTAQGANVLVNLSNDGYFGRTEARQQHLAIARMRAVENRRFLIRATNDGFSAIIDPSGRIIQTLPPYRQLAALAHYGRITEITPYARWGDWFVWSCLAIGLGLGIWCLRKPPTEHKIP
jgi:apolipoprotein N-acyltransferase